MKTAWNRSGSPAELRAAKRVMLLGCVKLKLHTSAPARELYVSSLWRKRRAYAEASAMPWLILSAKDGLVDPNQTLAPYDLALTQLSLAERAAWGRAVIAQLSSRMGSLSGRILEIHAGTPYRGSIALATRETELELEAPLAHLTLGQQLAWYRDALVTPPVLVR